MNAVESAVANIELGWWPEIGLSRQMIGDAGVERLVVSVSKSTTLRTIDLHANKIGDVGAAALARAVAENKSLWFIDLHANEIGDDGAKALAAALGKNVSLRNIDLYRNEIGDEGAEALAIGIEKSASLLWIDLGRNRVGEKGAKALAAALEKSMCLERVFGLTHWESMIDRAANLRRSRRAVWVVCGSAASATGTGPLARFVSLDGDHAALTRVLAFLLDADT